MWSENKKNISVWPQENKNITKCHVRKRKCGSKHILKKPILRSDRDLAHTKEQYITRTTTHSSCTIPQILTSQDQSILKCQENVDSLVYAVKQFTLLLLIFFNNLRSCYFICNLSAKGASVCARKNFLHQAPFSRPFFQCSSNF